MVESCKGSPKVSADIFMAMWDLLEPQKSDFSQKKNRPKISKPEQTPPCLVFALIWVGMYRSGSKKASEMDNLLMQI